MCGGLVLLSAVALAPSPAETLPALSPPPISGYTPDMTITLDVSPAVNGRAGLGRYAATLAAALERERPGAVRLFANLTSGARDLPELAGLPLRSVRIGYKPWRMAVWLGQLAGVGFDRLLPAGSALFHATEHLLLPLRRLPTVLTVHDLIYRLFPAHHRRLNYWYLNAAMPLYVRRASHIITISESSKRDLMRLYGTPAEKITVIYEAAAPHFKPPPAERIEAVRVRYGLPERTLITVGTIEPRKNLPRLIEALAALRRDDPALRLVIAGAKGWLTGGFFAALERFGQQEAVILPGYVSDEDLPALYAGATVAVQPSLYEGFGLPVLEAMACGVPVACSATSSLGEIAGDAALTFDPENVEEIIAALRRLLADADLREELRRKGFARAAEFSWERAARETWAVYDRLMVTGG
ncbi:MAG TPA: glycosyltransferase family 1 protein [Chloroflexi bacterium]|nr:glycosyltransferase family 1 protein [Chloroflexota bacterium]